MWLVQTRMGLMQPQHSGQCPTWLVQNTLRIESKEDEVRVIKTNLQCLVAVHGRPWCKWIRHFDGTRVSKVQFPQTTPKIMSSLHVHEVHHFMFFDSTCKTTPMVVFGINTLMSKIVICVWSDLLLKMHERGRKRRRNQLCHSLSFIGGFVV